MAVASVVQAAPRPASAIVTLDVPYLPQTDALCGGAAAAMVFRYWGDAHADVQAFAPLVDRRRGGIADGVLVEAVVQRGWRAAAGPGSPDMLRRHLAGGEPTVILIEDRATRYHYVVVVGADDDHVVVHDPAWGPSRRLTNAELTRLWRPSNFWSLVITPSRTRLAHEDAKDDTKVHLKKDSPDAICDRLLTDAVDEVARRGLAAADEALGAVRARCPDAAGPLRELAGVRFAERRWQQAAALAEQAVARDADDEYAWDVLGSSRFMQDDVTGALDAWNRIGRPKVDRVRIDRLTRARYALVADLVDLPTGALLTAARFRQAERRLRELPDVASVRIGYRPATDGYALVDIAIAEQPALPKGRLEWAAEAIRIAVNREVETSLPGSTGQGETWSLAWRWWDERPRAAFAFEAPRLGALPGLWRVDASWERQSYRIANKGQGLAREERAHAGLTTTDWLTSDVRYRLSAGLDSWTGRAPAVGVGGRIERRAWRDRILVGADATRWVPIASGAGFGRAGVFGAFRSSRVGEGVLLRVDAGVERVSAGAPYDIWPGAGDGHARPALLRAHPLLDGGIIAGPMFGRHLEHATGEVQRWLGAARPIRIGFAAFADTAHVADTANGMPVPFQVDAGAGLRLKVPGMDGVLRVDVAQALRGGGRALSVGIASPRR